MVEGVIAGWKRGKAFDTASTDISMIMYAMPTFWQCLLAIMFFSVALGWFPVGRMSTPHGALRDVGSDPARLHDLQDASSTTSRCRSSCSPWATTASTT